MDPFHSHDMKYLLSFPIALLKTGILTLLFMVGFHCIKLLHIFISYEINESGERFSVHFRGKQHAFISLLAVLTEHNSPDWSKQH